MSSFFQRTLASIKSFLLGPAAVDPYFHGTYGATGSTAVTKNGDFIASSVSVYACATLRAANLAGVPLVIYRTDAKGHKTPVTKGALYDLLQKVNPFWTWNRLVQMTELSLCLWGQAFWILERGQNGNLKPREIWWARPDKMTVVPDPDNYIKGFIYRDGGREIPFTPGEVVWFRYPHPLDEFGGLSPIASARLSIETGHQALRSNKRMFENGMQLAGIAAPGKADIPWSPEQMREFEVRLNRRFSGVENAHRVMVASHPIDIQSVGISPKDAEFLGLMKWSKSEVATAFKVPPELVGDHEHATYSNIDQAYKGFWTDCLVPEASFIAAELKEQLLPMFGNEADDIAFDLTGVSALQEDRADVVEQMVKLWNMGVPLNVLLQKFVPQLLPADGTGYPWGDTPSGQLAPSMRVQAQDEEGVPADQQGPAPGKVKPTDTPAENIERGVLLRGKAIALGSAQHEAIWKAFDDSAKKHERRIKAKVESLFERQAQAIIASLPKGTKAAGDFDPEDPFDQDDWNEEFAVEMLPVLERAVESAGVAVMEALAVSVDFNVSHPQVRSFLRGRAQRFASHVNETTWNRLKESLQEGLDAGDGVDELADRVRAELSANPARAEVIARTETLGALSGGALEAAKQSGVVKGKAWLASLDGRERDTHGRAHVYYQANPIPLDANFEVGSGAGPAPGQIGVAEEDIQCRCTMTWEIDEGDDPEKAAIRKEAASALVAWLAKTDTHAAHKAA